MINSHIYNLSPIYGLIELQGNDPLKFLQGLLTCDVNESEHKDHVLGAFCNIKGRIRALFRVFSKENHIFLMTPKELIPQLIPALKKYAIFSKISVIDSSEEHSIWGLSNTNEDPLILKDKKYFDSILQPSSYSLLKIPETENLSSDAGSTKFSRFIFIGPKKIEWKNLLPGIMYQEDSVEDWKGLDIQYGYPEIWLNTSEKFLPHHLNLPTLGAVSFTKGCYCGQEIIARMEYKANIKVGLKYIEMEAETFAKEKMLPGDECEFGTIVCSATIDQNRIKMLVICNKETDSLVCSG